MTTELDSWYDNFEGGPDSVQAYMVAQPEYAVFNALWHGPHELKATFKNFGLSTIAQAQAFAASLRDGTYLSVPANQAKFTSWIVSRPGITHAQMTAKSWTEIVTVFAGPTLPKASEYWVKPVDMPMFCPTLAQITALASKCQTKRYPWIADVHDCDNFTDEFKGWLSMHGIGSTAIARAEFVAYDANNVAMYAHWLCVVVLNDLTLRFIEPQTGIVWPITTTNLGKTGGFFAPDPHHIAFTAISF